MLKKHPGVAALLRLAAFAAVFLCCLLALDRFFYERCDRSPIWEYAADSESEPIDILFVGNSHVYTSVNARLYSEATGLNVRDFACSSVNAQIITAGLEAFLNYSVPKVVVVDTCAFTADNYDDMRDNKAGIVMEFFDGIPSVRLRARAAAQVLNSEDFAMSASQIFRPSDMWNRWTGAEKKTLIGFDSYGACPKYSVFADTPQLDADALCEQYSGGSPEMKKENMQAFDKILELAGKYDFEVWIYNAPMTVCDRKYVGALRYFEQRMQEEPRVKYIDDTMTQLDKLGLKSNDFFDATHVNRKGMEKVSLWYLPLICERFGVTSDTSASWGYSGESVTLLPDGSFRYEMRSYGGALFRFGYTSADGTAVDTGFTPCGWFTDGAISPAGVRVWMTASDSDLAAAEENAERVHFLSYTLEGYTYKAYDGGVMLKNTSNFAEDIVYSWQVVDCADRHTVAESGDSASGDFALSSDLLTQLAAGQKWSVVARTAQTAAGTGERITVVLDIARGDDGGLELLPRRDCVVKIEE